MAPVVTQRRPPPPSLLQAKPLHQAVEALLTPISKTGRILSLTALHSQVILQVQKEGTHSEVVEYRYREGTTNGPSPVTLTGPGKLPDNLFPRQAADPLIASQVLQRVRDGVDQHLVLRKLVMKRNLPRSRDIQFWAYLKGEDGDFVAVADKRGRLLGKPKPVQKPSTPKVAPSK